MLGRRGEGKALKEVGRKGKKKMEKAAWKNLISAGGVRRYSPPTRARRIDLWPPAWLPLTGQQGIPITVAALLTVDMDLTQQTHGRLLAALPFNNHYPSPSSSSPSISSVARVCGFPLFVCSGLSLLSFIYFLPLFYPHISLSSPTHFRLPYLIFFLQLLFLLNLLFISSCCLGFHILFNLFLFSLLFSSSHHCICWSNPQKNIL